MPTLRYPTAGLTSLSTELIYEICSFLSPRSEVPSLNRDPFPDILQYKKRPSNGLRHLRLTCHHLNQIVDPILFENLTFNFHVTGADSCDHEHQLSSLASNTSPALLYSKHISIVCLNPLQQDHATRLWKGMRFQFDDDPAIQTRASHIQISLDLYFSKALSSLRNLRSVKWNVANDGQASRVMAALLPLPSLEDIYLEFDQDFYAFETLGINRFTGLRKFGLSCHDYIALEETSKFPEHLAQLIRQNPLLSHLEFIGPLFSMDLVSFKNLARQVPSDRPLRLESLRLSNAVVEDEIMIHLRSLSSLALRYNAAFVSNSEDYDTQKIDNMMDNMRKEGITLKEFSVDRFSKSLFNFLASFSGLQWMCLALDNDCNHFMLDAASSNFFFQRVLPRHSQTLTTLILKTRLPTGGLVFNESLANPFKICPNLTRCGITLLIDHAPRCLKIVLDSIVASGVKLGILNIWYSDFKSPPLGCVNGFYSFEEKAQRAAHLWLKSLSITDPHLYPREIHLPGISRRRTTIAQLNDPYKLVPSADIPGRYVYLVPEEIVLAELADDRESVDEDYDSEASNDANSHVERTCSYYE